MYVFEEFDQELLRMGHNVETSRQSQASFFDHRYRLWASSEGVHVWTDPIHWKAKPDEPVTEPSEDQLERRSS